MPRLTFPLQVGKPVIDLIVSAALPRLHLGGAQVPGGIQLRALIDTGAKRTCVDTAAVRALGLVPVMKAAIRTASTGRSAMLRDVFDVAVASAGPPNLMLASAVGALSIDLAWSPYQCLLGRDVLANCRFVYVGPAGRFDLEV